MRFLLTFFEKISVKATKHTHRIPQRTFLQFLRGYLAHVMWLDLSSAPDHKLLWCPTWATPRQLIMQWFRKMSPRVVYRHPRIPSLDLLADVKARLLWGPRRLSRAKEHLFHLLRRQNVTKKNECRVCMNECVNVRMWIMNVSDCMWFGKVYLNVHVYVFELCPALCLSRSPKR